MFVNEDHYLGAFNSASWALEFVVFDQVSAFHLFASFNVSDSQSAIDCLLAGSFPVCKKGSGSGASIVEGRLVG